MVLQKLPKHISRNTTPTMSGIDMVGVDATAQDGTAPVAQLQIIVLELPIRSQDLAGIETMFFFFFR
jgi:hypothetical protein